MNRALYPLVSLLVLVLFTGCFEVGRGYYKGDRVAGWKKASGEGELYYYKNHPHCAIAFGSRLSIHLTTYSFWHRGIDWKSVKFSGDPIRIVFHDRPGDKTISADVLARTSSQSVDVENSKDFTVTIPSFKIGNDVVPSLTAHLRWVNKKYLISVELM